MQIRIEVSIKEKKGKSVNFFSPEKPIIIGYPRTPECPSVDLTIPESHISRQHLRVQSSEGKMQISDLHSKNQAEIVRKIGGKPQRLIVPTDEASEIQPDDKIILGPNVSLQIRTVTDEEAEQEIDQKAVHEEDTQEPTKPPVLLDTDPIQQEIAKLVQIHCGERSLAERPKKSLVGVKMAEKVIGLKSLLADRLTNALNLKKMENPGQKLIADTLKDILDTDDAFQELAIEEKKLLRQSLLDDILHLGPLGQFIKDPKVTEIIVQGNGEILVEKNGILNYSGVNVDGPGHTLFLAEQILAPLGRRLDTSNPLVDARLPDGSRVNIIILPVATSGPEISIRKFPYRYTISDLIRAGSLTVEMAAYLKAVVVSRLNIIISGGTSSGKTTLLNALGDFIPSWERVITIEGTREIYLKRGYYQALEARPVNIEGKGEITIRDLFRNALRMRPERIIVGEARGAEVTDMFQAMNSGHDGSLSTVHANNPQATITRLKHLYTQGQLLSEEYLTTEIGQGINLIVQTQRYPDGSRKVSQICEISFNSKRLEIEFNPLFIFKSRFEGGKMAGEFQKVGSSQYKELMTERGVTLNI